MKKTYTYKKKHNQMFLFQNLLTFTLRTHAQYMYSIHIYNTITVWRHSHFPNHNINNYNTAVTAKQISIKATTD